ncbi:MAG TPA: hypothetical protein VGX78_13680 [Pirellulales bacterium]|jgi:hypothetical protein|nr:hypothetical protein [Pirellulales bacterium]
MITLESGLLIYGLVAVQAIGLAAACLTRIGERSARQASYHRIFWGCLSLAGLATFISMLVGPGTCLASGATLALMLLTATWDFGGAVM